MMGEVRKNRTTGNGPLLPQALALQNAFQGLQFLDETGNSLGQPGRFGHFLRFEEREQVFAAVVVADEAGPGGLAPAHGDVEDAGGRVRVDREGRFAERGFREESIGCAAHVPNEVDGPFFLGHGIGEVGKGPVIVGLDANGLGGDAAHTEWGLRLKMYLLG